MCVEGWIWVYYHMERSEDAAGERKSKGTCAVDSINKDTLRQAGRLNEEEQREAKRWFP